MILAEDDASIDGALAYYFECLDRGEAVDEAGLVAKFPQLAEELKRFFADQRLLDAKVQQLRSKVAGGKMAMSNRLSVRCPNCRQPTEVAVDSTLSDIECPSCASQFSLIGPTAAMNGAPSLISMGRFQLLERLGVGAYGSVWKARDDALHRMVAVKIPRQGGMTADEQEKFFREARAAAQLRHPNIVSVHEVGREGDSVYIVSDFVHGMTLGDWLEGHQLTVREAAELGVTIAGALHHAHEQGVVHRDLKPANIIMDAAGLPHLMDFGLARRDVGEITVTMDGQVLGTPAYMSPEQAEGKAHEADCRSDVYSLGVILYQLLTGELPFRGNARMLLHQVIHDEPPGPRKLNAHVPRDMETIVGKAMEKRAADRYASARGLADDLRRYLAGEPIKARPASPLEKIVKWSRRHRTIVSVTALAAVLLSSVVVASFVLINKERVTALAALDETSELLYIADMNAAYDAWDQGWSDEAQSILARQKPKDARPDRRGLEWFLLERLARPPQPVVLAGHVGPVDELAVFPDRKRLASVGEDGTLRIWDLHNRKLVRKIALCDEGLTSVAISPDGRFIAAGSKDAAYYNGRMKAEGAEKKGFVSLPEKSTVVYLCDIDAGYRVKKVFQGPASMDSLAFSPDGQRLAVGTRYDGVSLVTLEGNVIQRIACASRLESLEFVPGQSQLLVPNRYTKGDGEVLGIAQLWHDDLTAMEGEFRPRHTGVRIARSSPCGDFIAATGEEGSKIYVFHRSSGRIALQTKDGREMPTALSYSPDGGTIAIGYVNGVFEFFSIGRSSEEQLFISRTRRAIDGHHADIFDVEFIEPGVIATCAADGLIKVWDLSQAVHHVAPPKGSEIVGITPSPDGELLACVTRENLMILNHQGTIVAKHRLNGGPGGMAWSPSGHRLAICCGEKEYVNVHDKTGKLIRTIGHDGAARAVAFSPDGQRLAVIGNKYLQIHRSENGGEIHRQILTGDGGNAVEFWPDGHPGPVQLAGDFVGGSAVEFSPDGRYLAYAGRFGAVALADGAGNRIERKLLCASPVRALAFSADGSLVASGHEDSVIRLWSTNSGVLKSELAKHEQPIDSLAFSTDGSTLLSGAKDGTIRVWSVAQSRQYGIAHRIIPLEEVPYSGLYAATPWLSSDSKWLAFIYRDRDHGRIVDLWDLRSSAPRKKRKK
jgi:serine/threonine protein kinase/dipeptidyl aminopeptidase/acylaminoacyl peptidase